MAKREKRMSQEEPRGGKIRVHIIDEENGYQHLENVRAVRIKSSDYTLLILEDFTPTLGSVEGDVVFILSDREKGLENIRGYYKHQQNEFTLLVQEDRDGWYEEL